MNNEPVAWRKSETDSEGQYFVYREEEPRWLEGYIPLYTHPADESFDRTASHMAGEYVRYSENSSAEHWKEQAKIYKDDLLEAQKLFQNAKPVAWMDYLEHSDVYDLNVSGRGIPLYTHPAKTLTELSGVEIIGMSGKYDFNYEVDIIDFARAILRKAQEK